MPQIYSLSTNDGWIRGSIGTSTWNAARNDSGQMVNSTDSRFFFSVGAFQSARGGGTFRTTRSFFQFDVSSITVTPSSASFYFFNHQRKAADLILVRSEQDLNTLAAGDYNSLYGASSQLAATDGSGTGSLASVSGLTYSSSYSTGSINSNAYNAITLNATALSDLASLNVIRFCLMQYSNDYLDITPSGIQSTGLYFSDTSGTSVDPYIDYTAGTAVATNNANFFGTNF